MNKTDIIWNSKLKELLLNPQYVSKPRGMEVHERLGEHYSLPMPAFLNLKSRKVNSRFMFAEAAWILEGSNRLDKITPYIKNYKDFSDDGVFLRGAYGPKITDQLGYVVDSIVEDKDTRQAVINIWRERPGVSRDIPCTISMQFLLRENKLNLVVTMRSQDIVWGYTYDVFTFSMVAKAVKLLLKDRGVVCNLGRLYVNVGSLHLYEKHYEDAKKWINETEIDVLIGADVSLATQANSYQQLIERLWEGANFDVKAL